MVCIYCASPTRVTNSRHQRQHNHVWRRRECLSCGAVFTTVEAPDYHKSIAVETTAQALSSFKKEKLLISILKSCDHRKDALDDAIALTDTVIAKTVHASSEGLINVHQLAQIVFTTLQSFDYASAVQYAAHHSEHTLL